MVSASSAIVLLSLLPSLASAYTWTFGSTPKQCQNISISISGSGQPPYRVLIIPFGPTPLADNVEARRIIDHSFDASATSTSFQLNYPANSQLVAVVSDASGFGSGGTSVAAQVLSSSDDSCFDSKTNVQPDFVFNLDPPNQIVQCAATRIWWDSSTVQGNPAFLGVIPGGQSFSIPQGQLSNVTQEGVGFSWTPSLRGGTTLILVGGDSRGAGSAGSVLNTVGFGLTPSTSCLDSSSPSSTPGSPAGGSYPTSSSGASTGGGSTSSGKSNVGAIVGGVVGGIVGLAALGLLLLFFHRRNKLHASSKERPVDLFTGGDDEGDEGATRAELPQYYQPEPFVVPDPTRSSVDASRDGDQPQQHTADGRPLSGVTSTSRSGTPEAWGASSAATRKSAIGPRLRPVNIIQHDDAGPSAPKPEAEEAETIELPPAYTNLRK